MLIKIFIITLAIGFISSASAQNKSESKGVRFTFYTLHKLGRYDSIHYYTNPVFLLQNNTDTTFVTSGYGKEKDSIGMLANLIYSREEKRNGKWQHKGFGWCGNNLGADTLLPRGQMFVQFRPDQKEDAEAVKFTVGLRVLNADVWRNVTSDEIVLK
jgi:hypothetical protein